MKDDKPKPQHCIECRHQNTMRNSGVVNVEKDVDAINGSLFCKTCQPKTTGSTYNKRSGWYLPYNNQRHGDPIYSLICQRIWEAYGLSLDNCSMIDGISIFHDPKTDKPIKRMVLRNFFVGTGTSVYDIPSEEKK